MKFTPLKISHFPDGDARNDDSLVKQQWEREGRRVRSAGVTTAVVIHLAFLALVLIFGVGIEDARSTQADGDGPGAAGGGGGRGGIWRGLPPGEYVTFYEIARYANEEVVPVPEEAEALMVPPEPEQPTPPEPVPNQSQNQNQSPETPAPDAGGAPPPSSLPT
jgi:hypothetical protein